MELSSLFLRERDIPYAISLSVNEVGNSCAGKHDRLKRAFEKEGIVVRDRICWFAWSHLGIPKDVLAISHDDESTHLYLEILRNGEWNVVDASWDSGLASVLPVNAWKESGNMTVAVPVLRSLSPEESIAYMTTLSSQESKKELERNREFYQALNAWFVMVRNSELS